MRLFLVYRTCISLCALLHICSVIMATLVHGGSWMFMSWLTRCYPRLRLRGCVIYLHESVSVCICYCLTNLLMTQAHKKQANVMTKLPVFLWANSTTVHTDSTLALTLMEACFCNRNKKKKKVITTFYFTFRTFILWILSLQFLPFFFFFFYQNCEKVIIIFFI